MLLLFLPSGTLALPSISAHQNPPCPSKPKCSYLPWVELTTPPLGSYAPLPGQPIAYLAFLHVPTHQEPGSFLKADTEQVVPGLHSTGSVGVGLSQLPVLPCASLEACVNHTLLRASVPPPWGLDASSVPTTPCELQMSPKPSQFQVSDALCVLSKSFPPRDLISLSVK